MEYPLCPGIVYHIYNRGNNRENIFREQRNYPYFLRLYTDHVAPTVDTFAYCLLRNHFHLLVRVKEAPQGENALQKFSNFFNAYARAYNRAYNRTGALFQRSFKRLPVTSDRHYLALVAYIHTNPQKHNFVDDFRKWHYSSYAALISDRPTHIAREEVLGWFGGQEALVDYHAHLEPAALQDLPGLAEDET